MNDDIRMVGMDFDLTLVDYPNGRARVPEPTQELLKSLIGRGLEVGIVSGRPWWDMRDMLERVGMGWGNPFPSFFVACETFLFWMRNGKMEPDAEWNAARGKESEALSRRLMPEAAAWLGGFERHGLRVSGWNLFSNYGLEVHFPKAEEAEQARQLLTQWAASVPMARVHRNRMMAQVILATAGKGNSLLRAARNKGLNPAQVLAVGDTLNDLDMLDGSFGFRSGAVGNAEEAVKAAVRAAGGMVASQEAGAGLAEILTTYCGK